MPFTDPRSAYIHVPFCRRRCGYCDFAIVAGRDDLIGPYLRAIATELSWLGEARPVETLYFGGGTPSHLDPADLAALCDVVLRWHPLASGHEWTIEANPEYLGADRLRVLAERGATRLSLGAQSLEAGKLRALDRQHLPQDVYAAVELAREAGMQVSLDLIFGAPGETLADWRRDLARAVDLAPDHVSTYGLTWERGTKFTRRRDRGELTPVDEELERQMYALAIDRLADAGFEHYEVSNFARPGFRSRHNETYWTGGEYYAAGPGAARYVAGVRETNHRSTTTYLKRVLAGESPVAEREELDAAGRARERLVFGLRRLDGVERRWFRGVTGFSLEEIAGEPLRRFVAMGLLADDGDRVRLTREGLFVSDALWPELL
ncbi:MAG: coproporphyrinogen III oxidase [Planctomycetota bacterium]|nr:MAG: coproporphyrinogen III oxidase [Planctomycetota bacterium]